MKSDTDLGVMDGTLKFDDTHSDSDDDDDIDIVWGIEPKPVVKYSEQEKLNEILDLMQNKMLLVKRNVELITQRELLLAQSTSKSSKKRRRKKTQEPQERPSKKTTPS
jgi:hypothetical protein